MRTKLSTSAHAALFNLLENDTLTATELNVLDDIAKQCPLEGGDAVYEARAILGGLTGWAYDDVAICTDALERSFPGENNVTHASPVIYPNPTTGEVRWNVPGQVTVRVFNAIGQLKQAAYTINDQRVSLAGFEPGTYFMQLQWPDSQVSIHTILLVR